MIENIEVSGSALEYKLKRWSVGPSTTEQQMCENAEKVIKNALNADPRLSQMDTTIFTKGSFKNRTNIARYSDVDVCIRLNSVFYGVYPEGKTSEDLGYGPGKIDYSEFKSLVHSAIRKYINSGTIEVGDKSIKIRQNSYRVDADIVPALVHKLWDKLPNSYGSYTIRAEGIGIYSEKEQRRIFNWPAQDHDNGISKNSSTGRMFKRAVRILKNLQCEMKGNQYINDEIASFLIESLVWNVPNSSFHQGDYRRTIRSILAHLFNNLREKEFNYEDWTEVNNMKYLFHEVQPWTRAQAFHFVGKAWDYLGFDE